LIARDDVADPVFRFGMGLLVNVQVAPVGNPELQDSDTESGNIALVGRVATVTVYAAGVPAGTVALAGDAEMLKSVTVAEAFAVAVKLVPGTEI
jgi:hypothetical protein